MTMILFFLFLIFSVSNASVQDFCVADLKGPESPSGYPCKNPATITANDFVFSGLRTAGNISAPFKIGLVGAAVSQFPAVNGLGLSFARVDFASGGVIPIHSHPGATEAYYLVEGTVTAGFISSVNKVYLKELSKGDVMIFPQGLLHFAINTGKTPATAFVSFSSTNPRVQTADLALFGNNLSSSKVQQITLLDQAQVAKLKGLFGGSG